MSREIRFRAWNGSHMLQWDWLCAMGQISSRFFDKDLPDRGYEIMQFTGLLDRNGVDIYEGDIIEWAEPVINPLGGQRRVVRFEQGEFLIPYRDPSLWRVIGNIWQSSELLTKAGSYREGNEMSLTSEPCDFQRDVEHLEIEELAQKLYAEDGYAGNLYRSGKDRLYEDKAQRILEGRA